MSSQMKHNVSESLQELLVPIDQLNPLPGNPRRGAVDAIRASYERFGQVKPIIAVPEDGKFTVIAGNHQLQACIELGWTHMAVLVKDEWDRDTAIAFALADNRTAELGSIDQEELFEMLSSVSEPDYELFEALEWDDFEIALMEDTYQRGQVEHEDTNRGFTPPTLVTPPAKPSNGDSDKEEEITFEGDDETARDVVTRGATVTGQAGGHPTFQYTLAFTLEEQKEWYAFLRFLKEIEKYQDMNTGTQVIAYLKEVRNG